MKVQGGLQGTVLNRCRALRGCSGHFYSGSGRSRRARFAESRSPGWATYLQPSTGRRQPAIVRFTGQEPQSPERQLSPLLHFLHFY